MKKYLPGFVPVNYKKSGKIILLIGAVILIAKLISYLTAWLSLSNYFIYLAIALALVGLYLIYIVPKE